MSKTAKAAGGRTSRAERLREMEQHIGQVESGEYLDGLKAEYRKLNLAEALSEARGLLGSSGVSLVESMLKMAEGNPGKTEGLRGLLVNAKLPAKLVARIMAEEGPIASKESTSRDKRKPMPKRDPQPEMEPEAGVEADPQPQPEADPVLDLEQPQAVQVEAIDEDWDRPYRYE